MPDAPWPYTQSWPFRAKLRDGRPVEVLALDLTYAWVSCCGHRPYTVRVEHVLEPDEMEKRHAA